MAAVPLSTERLSVAFQTQQRGPMRWLNLSLLLSLSIAAGLLARLGTGITRAAAALLLISAVVQIFVRRARDRRDFGDVQRTIRRVLVPVDRAVGERALRAAALAEQAARDPRVGSVELAQLHFQRQLERAPLAAVEAQAARRASLLRMLALGLVLIAALGVGRDPNRVLEGLDVLSARQGLAPVPMPWLDLVRVTVQPPAYLHLPDRSVFPGL